VKTLIRSRTRSLGRGPMTTSGITYFRELISPRSPRGCGSARAIARFHTRLSNSDRLSRHRRGGVSIAT